MSQTPFNPFDESPSGQRFNQFFPPFNPPGSFPMNPPPPPGGPGSFPMNPPPPGPGPGGGPGGGPGPGGGGNSPMPMGPPPAFSPQMPMLQSQSQYQSGSSGIRRCIYRNTFIWQRNGNSFWFFPTFVTRNDILGFRWGRFGWVPSTVNRNSILTFQCF